jgi:hypothetical protein
MKIGKKILVGSIVLFFTTTSILGGAKLSVNNNPSPLNSCDNNCIGTVSVVHQSGFFNMILKKGAILSYEPPVGNPTYQYYFPEDEDGFVYMNFTLHIQHRLNPTGVYWLSKIWPENHRFTMVDVWVYYGQPEPGEDYCFNESLRACYLNNFTQYDMPIKYTVPLPTNNVTLKCKLWITVYTIYTPIQLIQLLCKRAFHQDAATPYIYINPV